MINLATPADRELLEKAIKHDIDAFCETYYEQGHRNHLGASELGNECWRQLWYKFRWVKLEYFEGRVMRLFNVGHAAEPRFIAYLRGIGFEVREYATTHLMYDEIFDLYSWHEGPFPSNNDLIDVTEDLAHEAEAAARGIKPKQFRIIGANGHYGGSLDGMCKAPAKYQISDNLVFLNEFKTNGTGAGYNDVATKGLAKAKPVHFAQMSQYGFKLGLKYGIYLIENKNDSDITIKIVELDWNLGAQLERKAEEIINAREPPNRISDNPAMFNCKYCTFSGICHHGEPVEKNCRSCRNCMPTENGSWTCSRFGVIPEDFIPKGCDEWLSI